MFSHRLNPGRTQGMDPARARQQPGVDSPASGHRSRQGPDFMVTPAC